MSMLNKIVAGPGLSPEEKAGVIRNIIIFGFVCSVFIHYILGGVLGMGFPYNTFLLKPSHHFVDYYSAVVNLYKPLATGIYYLPFTYLLIRLFSFSPQLLAQLLYIAVFVVFFCFYAWINVRDLRVDKALTFFVFAFLTYPFLYVIDHGNTEMFVFMLLGSFFLCYPQKKVLAAVFLSMAIAAKLYPAVFLLLYLRERKYLSVFLITVLACALTVVSAAQLPGGISGSIGAIFNNYLHMGDFVNTLRVVLSNSVSLYAAFRLLTYGLFWAMPGYFPVTRIELPPSDMGFNYKIAFGSSAQLVLHWLNLLYPALIAVLFAVIIYYLFSAKREKWKSYYLLIAAVIILPQFSFAYRLLLLLIPMYLFIKCPERKSLDLIYAVSFALLLIPKEFLIVVADVSLATIIDPLLILFTGCLIVCEGRLKGQGG